MGLNCKPGTRNGKWEAGNGISEKREIKTKLHALFVFSDLLERTSATGDSGEEVETSTVAYASVLHIKVSSRVLQLRDQSSYKRGNVCGLDKLVEQLF